MKKVLITGGTGFLGDLLKRRLLDNGFFCVNIDFVKDEYSHPNLVSIQGDIRDNETMTQIFSQNNFDGIFHCAAILAHAVKDKKFLWSCNVEGTKNVAQFAQKYSVPKVIFTSSNCLWGENADRPITEQDKPNPVEIYGKSKWEAETILLGYKDYFDSIIFRCPTIIDYGRLGLLTILFEFIDEGRKVWVVGGGNNKYQFIYAQDLIDACIKALDYNHTDIFNIGSDNVISFKEMYSYIIQKANTGAKVASLPKKLAIFAMKVAYFLKISPLGPYQYKMIAENFQFNTTKIKEKLNWMPTLTNEEMLLKAYEYYHNNKEEIYRRKGVSAHKQAVKLGVIRFLKWIS